ncbi:MAG: hypothetical protein M3Y64_08830 [Gemmatimonadota bacterium]|nr:hypothetical protein [Gemmatimonadota bacterium]
MPVFEAIRLALQTPRTHKLKSSFTSANSFSPLTLPPLAILAAFGATCLTGILFGLIPAARASRLDPVDALRNE